MLLNLSSINNHLHYAKNYSYMVTSGLAIGSQVCFYRQSFADPIKS